MFHYETDSILNPITNAVAPFSKQSVSISDRRIIPTSLGMGCIAEEGSDNYDRTFLFPPFFLEGGFVFALKIMFLDRRGI